MSLFMPSSSREFGGKIPQHEILKHYLISKKGMGESVRDIFVDFPITEFAKLVELPRQTIKANVEVLLDMLGIIIHG